MCPDERPARGSGASAVYLISISLARVPVCDESEWDRVKW